MAANTGSVIGLHPAEGRLAVKHVDGGNAQAAKML
jgi:hypothetical protein